MYRVLEALRQPDESNESLAERLGIEINRRADTGKPDVTDLSRTFSDKSFRRILEGLRSWAIAHPEEWFRMLASSREGALWNEYKDLLFISEDFWAPAHQALKQAYDAGHLDGVPEGAQFASRLKNETWIVTGDTSAVDVAREREFSALRIRIGHRFVYWLPKSEAEGLARRILAEFRFTKIVDAEQLEAGCWFIIGPDSMGYTPNFAISSPHGEYPICVTGTRNEASNIRVLVMPEQIATRTVRWMRGIYIELVDRGTHTTPDGFEWRLLRASELEGS